VINFDAKLSFDDNAKFRQANIFDMEDTAESDQREVEATRAGLNYIGLQGNIGCLGKLKSIESFLFLFIFFE
jgi:succinyl-CoA synthetase beta subunit